MPRSRWSMPGWRSTARRRHRRADGIKKRVRRSRTRSVGITLLALATAIVAVKVWPNALFVGRGGCSRGEARQDRQGEQGGCNRLHDRLLVCFFPFRFAFHSIGRAQRRAGLLNG